jgi:hypothetical protein
MTTSTSCLVTIATTFACFAATFSAAAEPLFGISVQRIADPTVPVPGGGFFDAGFLYPSVEGNQVVFEGGTNSPPFRRGLYRYNLSTGSITTIADTTMTAPGTVERFRSFGAGGDVPGVGVENGKVVFNATITDFLSPQGINYALYTDLNGPLEPVAYLTDANIAQPAGFPKTLVPGPWPATNQPNPPGPGSPPITYRPPPFYFNGVLADPSLDQGKASFVGWFLGRVPTGSTGVSENGLFQGTPATLEKVTDTWGPEPLSVDPEGFLLFRSVFGSHADGGSIAWMQRTFFNPPGPDTLSIVERTQVRVGPNGSPITVIARSENRTDSLGRQYALGDPTPETPGYLLWDQGGENGTPPPVMDDSGTSVVFSASSLASDFLGTNPRASAIEGVYRWDAPAGPITRVIDSTFSAPLFPAARYEYFIRPAVQGDLVITVGAYNDTNPGIDYDLIAIQRGPRPGVQRLLGSGDTINGRIIRTITTHRDGLDANRIAFRAQFSDGTSGVFLLYLFPICPCTADFDNSGGTPDASDIDAYFQAWLNGNSSADADCSGGTPDASDIDAFFVSWLDGGC